MAILWRWGFDKLVKMIICTLLNKYDMFMIIEGGTGIGKSSFAINLAVHVRREFRKLKKLDYETVKYYYDRLNFEQKGVTHEDFIKVLLNFNKRDSYNFKLSKHLIYTQDSMQKFLSGWYEIGISDEMINVTFNRDFFSEAQKNIIKMINMFRDHFNLVIACVPNFNVLDKQIKDLCKVRISIVRRGIALIQTPNKTFYGKDKWDTSFNEKIEREWLMNKTRRPQYTRLTTFRGLVKFPKLNPKTEKVYQKIKNKKRSVILREEMGIETGKKKSKEDVLYDRLLNGGVKNMQIIEGIAIGSDETLNTLRARLSRRLEKEGKDPRLGKYFWGKKGETKKEMDEDFKDKIKGVGESL